MPKRSAARLSAIALFALASCSPFKNAGDAPDVNGDCPNPSAKLVAFYGSCRQTCLVDTDCGPGTVCTCGGAWAPFDGGGKDPGPPFGVCLSPCTDDGECTPMKRCRFATRAEAQSTIPPHELECVDAKPICAKDGFCHATCFAGDAADSFCNDGSTTNDTCSDTTSGSICTSDQICGQR